jgi:voltage-gated potassium channel
MIMTTLGSNYWPLTAEGRLLTLLLSLYAFAVFGYVTATLATFFIGRDAAEPEDGASLVTLSNEIAALREEIRMLNK